MSTYKICVLGKKNHLNWDVHVAEAFRGLGHDVKLVQFNVYPLWVQGLRGLLFLFFGRAKMREYGFRWGANRWKRLLEKKQPDFIFMTNANFVPKCYYHISQSFRPRSKIFVWDGDGFAGVEEYIPQVDHLFECGMALQREHPEYAKKVSTLCFAVNDRFYSNKQKSDRENKVYFCAAQKPIRMKYLSALADFPVVLKGWGWDCFVGQMKNWEITNRAISNEQLRDDYNRYAIALNVSQFELESYMLFNMRTFEAPCCGACLVTQRSPHLDDYFEFDKEIVVYDNPEELKQKVQWLLDNPEIRSEIAAAGEARVKKDHTYQARMRLVIDRYEQLLSEDGYNLQN
jgi:glycosyltransferase involved in cell wall biosynthesis